MARIDKLKIQGIRSFGPDDENAQAIVFQTPITCIVGQNGCGKTTIIESLRFATTGNAPPSTNAGKSFVYDPKLTLTGEVKGQVKLQFISVKGQTMQVTRTLQVTQRLNKLELKTVDPIFNVVDENGKIQAAAGRCMDIKNVVLSNLGISEAILDNVIFCHQEDSLWPLDEGKKLKEKFDDIFDSAKYNKASDQINKLIKTKESELKVGKNIMKFMHDYYEAAMVKQETLDGKTAEFVEGNNQMERIKTDLKPLEDQLNLTHQREKRFQDLQSKIHSKETEKKLNKEIQDELENGISNPHLGSKVELQAIMKEFHAQLHRKKEEIAEQEGEVTHLQQQETDMTARMNVEQTKLGALQQERKNNEETIRQRLHALRGLARDLAMQDLQEDAVESREEMDAALRQVDTGVRIKEKDLQTMKKALNQEEQNLQKEIDQKREERVKVDQKVKSLEHQLVETQDQLDRTKEEISQVDTAVTQLAVVQNRLERADKQYEEVSMQMNCEDTQDVIKSTQEQRDRLQDEVAALEEEVEILQRASSLQAEADVHRASMKSKEQEIAQMKDKHRSNLVLLFGSIPERGLQTQLETSIKQKERDIKDLQGRVAKSQSEISKLKTEELHLQQKLQEHEKKLKKHQAAITDACGDRNFDTVLSEIEDDLRRDQNQKGVLDSSEVLFRRYIATIKQQGAQKPCCPLCHRDFEQKREAEKLLSELQSKIATFPEQKTDIERRIAEMKVRQGRLQELKPARAELEELQNTILPKLKEDKEQKVEELMSEIAMCEELRAQLKGPEKQLSVATDMRPDARLLEQHEIEVKRLAKEIQRIEQRLPQTGSGRSLQEVQNAQREARSEVQRLQREAEKRQNELNAHQKKVAELREQRNKLQEELLKIQAGAQKRAQLLERRRELSNQTEVLNDQLDRAREAVHPAKTALEEAERAKKRAQENNQQIIDKLAKDVSALQVRVDNLKRLNAAVESYETRGVARDLASLETSLAVLQERREKLLGARQVVREKIDQLNTELSTQQVREREMADNLKLLEKREQGEEIERQLEHLCAELGTLDYVQLMQEKKRLTVRINSLISELDQLKGKQDNLKKNIEELEAELEKDTYKNAAMNYRNQLVKNEVMSHSILDLRKYFLALNQSMIHFHQERMEAVNRIIRDLWVSIYKGSDIDYIAIKTDDETTGGRVTATMRRTYNYRVVMVKRGTELDMRGRCSAGQKMLASLVIRIALAETFSANCGILALDEPTTNLDHENIESLCTSLVDLAQNHRFQNNFQLLVITHDEDFIERLTQAGLMEHFYRVSRNDRGFSTLSKFRVGD